MSKSKPPKSPRRPPGVVEGGRVALERELMWAIALDGDRRRIKVLRRMLRPAANDAFSAAMVQADPTDQGSSPDNLS
jgi:hypothetical protein